MTPRARVAVVAALAVLVVIIVVLKQNKTPTAKEGVAAGSSAARSGASTPQPDEAGKTGPEPPRPEEAAPPTAPALPKLIEVGAGKCIPCKLMRPILERLKKEYEGKMVVEIIDLQEDPEATRRYGISVIPTQIFYDSKGKELARHEGFIPAEDILAKWKELGVDLSGAKPAAFERLDPAKPMAWNIAQNSERASRLSDTGQRGEADSPASRRPEGVCPPFHLLDEDGNTIDPVKGTNADKPYSPKQTCGQCHDYEKITRAYHFTMGADEKPTPDMAARCGWVTTPGFYGGNWCSPAPLYNYLSPKKNASAATMDMTSFSIMAIGCGSCHPGGGSAEYDRAGRRYDRWMADPASGFTSGGDNNFDGDYYKARWTESGVVEADCLLCHLPGYNFPERDKQLKALNFRWAATAGAGLATVTGSVEKGEPVTVTYDKTKFGPDGTLSPNIVRQPRNEACLACHAQPGWKKRGFNFRSRTDVHVRAGLRCTDCHPAGSSADDPRIRGKELHEIGKGDDPGGLVRNDLDNTCRTCTDCHDTGRFGAPVTEHRWLPRVHLDKIACETCHIPERLVKPIQFQASDVFNPGTKIPSKGKHLWTFYGPEGAYRNHYGYLVMEGYDDKPTEPFKPFLVRYKGKIYPVNRVHTAWPGIEIEGQTALMQPKMSDVYRMWTEHMKDKSKFPELAKITDDNGDGVIEVNRPEEIDALIASVTQLLKESNYPMDGKRVVWVYNDRVYRSGTEYRTVPKHEWEASPYGNVHKYSHDVYAAKAALGAKGCTDCHSDKAAFFFAPVPTYPFGPDARPVTVPQYKLLGYAGSPPRYEGVPGATAAFFKWLTILVLAGLGLHIMLDLNARWRERTRTAAGSGGGEEMVQRFNEHLLAQHLLLMASLICLAVSGVFLWGLRYSGASWAAGLTSALGGVDLWRWVHRGGGGVLTFVCFYHLVYALVHPEGRRDFVAMLPRLQDFRDFARNLAWFVGIAKERPKFGRFSYFEKFDYWAVFWGAPIMIVTGVAMWFPEILQGLFPASWSTLLYAFKEAHAHEALLAVVTIALWHTYNVHLRPGRFPGSLFFIHGRMSRAEMEAEHPNWREQTERKDTRE